MIGTPFIEDLGERAAALRAALKTAMPRRIHKKAFNEDFAAHQDEELQQGVVMFSFGSENDYSQQPGMEAKEGTSSNVILVQFIGLDDSDSAAIEDEEFVIAAQIKNFVEIGVPGLGLNLVSITSSAQRSTPYGWVLAQLDAGPPLDNLI